MFLKFRYRLGYETLCREVAASIGWQRFCRIPLGGRTPHPTTLIKITTRCGPEVVAQPNEALVAKAVAARLVKTGCGWTPLWLKPTLSIPPIRSVDQGRGPDRAADIANPRRRCRLPDPSC